MNIVYFRSRLLANKFKTFVFFVLTTFFVTYYIQLYQTPGKPIIIYINNVSSDIWNKSSKSLPSDSNSQIYFDRFSSVFIPNGKDKAKSPPTCAIMIRTTDGAIGNRMFLFASAYGLARLHQCQLYVAPYILHDLRSTFTININNTPVHLIANDDIENRTDFNGRYSACTLFNDLLKIPLDSNLTRFELIGFYQAYGYFIQYRNEISYLFEFNQLAIQRNIPLVEHLLRVVWNISLNFGNYTKDNITHRYLKSLLVSPPASLRIVTWIAIHIRRGDFLTFFKIDTSVQYLNAAMNYYRRKYINCRFLVASDDKDYAQANLGNNSDVFITPNSFFHGDDLAALALCEHAIITAGSYGWWGAWLAGGNVVHDLNYPVPSQNCKREHYFPPWFLFPRNSSSLGVIISDTKHNE